MTRTPTTPPKPFRQAKPGPMLGPMRRLWQDEPVFAGAALVILLSMLPTLLAMLIDTRLFQLENVWIKPFKFQVSLCAYLATLALYARWLPEALRKGRRYRIYSWVVVGAIAAESLWINGAASFAVASHFNTSSAAMRAIYGLMGLLAVTLTSASAVYGVAIWRNRAAGLGDGMRAALGLGLVLTFPLTVLTAGYMSSGPGHFVGTPVTGASLPLMGWSAEVGDLRLPHFFATHAMHVVPLAALVLRAGAPLAWLIGAAYGLFTLAVFVQAALGLPLIAL